MHELKEKSDKSFREAQYRLWAWIIITCIHSRYSTQDYEVLWPRTQAARGSRKRGLVYTV